MKKIQEAQFIKVFLQVKRLGKGLYKDVFKLKHIDEKYDNIRKPHGNGRTVFRAQHPTA